MFRSQIALGLVQDSSAGILLFRSEIRWRNVITVLDSQSRWRNSTGNPVWSWPCGLVSHTQPLPLPATMTLGIAPSFRLRAWLSSLFSIPVLCPWFVSQLDRLFASSRYQAPHNVDRRPCQGWEEARCYCRWWSGRHGKGCSPVFVYSS